MRDQARVHGLRSPEPNKCPNSQEAARRALIDRRGFTRIITRAYFGSSFRGDLPTTWSSF